MSSPIMRATSGSPPKVDSSADAKGLVRFLRSKSAPGRTGAGRSQAFGEAVEPHRLDNLVRYEVLRDRRLEHMLAMLLKLKELRGPAEPT
jgi:hypothetical protein